MDVGGAQDHVMGLVQGIDSQRFELIVAVGSSGGSRGELRAALDGLVEVVDLKHLVREVSPYHDLRAIPELGRLIDRTNPEILHTHSSKAGILGRLAARSRPISTVHNVHGWSFNALRGPARLAAIRLERWLATTTDTLIVVSESDLRTSDEQRIRPRSSITLIRSGIDISKFRNVGPTISSAIGDTERGNSIIIGTVGRLAEQKDPLTAIRAFALAASLDRRLSFRWIGDGPLRTQAMLESERLGISDRCEFAGTKHDIPEELQGLDVFVLSSRWEGLPRSLIEAAASGVPIVATDVGGVSEFIRPGTTGLLVPSAQPDLLARAIIELLDDPQKASDMSCNAAFIAETEFSAYEMCRRTESAYERIAT